jgi:hypothetical protein
MRLHEAKGLTPTFSQYEKIRRSIQSQNWLEAENVIQNCEVLDSASTRTVVYVIVETCRRTGNLAACLPLLFKLPEKHFRLTTENDILPLLGDSVILSSFTIVYDLINFLFEKNVVVSAKSFSSWLKNGIGTKNPSEIDLINKVLRLIIDQNVLPDQILINTLLDAYVRYSFL